MRRKKIIFKLIFFFFIISKYRFFYIFYFFYSFARYFALAFVCFIYWINCKTLQFSRSNCQIAFWMCVNVKKDNFILYIPVNPSCLKGDVQNLHLIEFFYFFFLPLKATNSNSLSYIPFCYVYWDRLSSLDKCEGSIHTRAL